jgi:4-oxalocrotonate tautomerase
MPVITVDIAKITNEQKKGLIEKLSAAAETVTKIPLNAFVVVINECEDDNIGVGGKPLSEIKKARP